MAYSFEHLNAGTGWSTHEGSAFGALRPLPRPRPARTPMPYNCYPRIPVKGMLAELVYDWRLAWRVELEFLRQRAYIRQIRRITRAKRAWQ